MDYIEVKFYNNVSLNEIIIAWLGENQFDMFEENDDGLNAYIPSELFNENQLKEIIGLIPDSEKNIRFETSFIKDQNWNTKWESNFESEISVSLQSLTNMTVIITNNWSRSPMITINPSLNMSAIVSRSLMVRVTNVPIGV